MLDSVERTVEVQLQHRLAVAPHSPLADLATPAAIMHDKHARNDVGEAYIIPLGTLGPSDLAQRQFNCCRPRQQTDTTVTPTGLYAGT